MYVFAFESRKFSFSPTSQRSEAPIIPPFLKYLSSKRISARKSSDSRPVDVACVNARYVASPWTREVLGRMSNAITLRWCTPGEGGCPGSALSDAATYRWWRCACVLTVRLPVCEVHLAEATDVRRLAASSLISAVPPPPTDQPLRLPSSHHCALSRAPFRHP